MVNGSFFEQIHTQARFTAACHTNADRMGRQVAGIVHHQFVGELVFRQVKTFAKIKGAQFFEIHTI
ncbi:MAG: hypothetical protein BWY63_01744 [Chloroflexi bacterium ADurb.Bin360]|nr:MAG: hypothetical protein BWY63_01744 [Chloroflexi bacterium ADurb.Bin360]